MYDSYMVLLSGRSRGVSRVPWNPLFTSMVIKLSVNLLLNISYKLFLKTIRNLIAKYIKAVILVLKHLQIIIIIIIL